MYCAFCLLQSSKCKNYTQKYLPKIIIVHYIVFISELYINDYFNCQYS